jgi:hypothetical protein
VNWQKTANSAAPSQSSAAWKQVAWVTWSSALPLEDQAGAVWILYLNTDGTVSREEKIAVTESYFDLPITGGGHFGEVITNTGDIDMDGITDLAVGVPFDDDAGPDSGAVFIFFMNNESYVVDII